VLDEGGRPMPNTLVEMWQANAAGRAGRCRTRWSADANGKHNHPDDPQDKTPDPAFRGFGRLPSDKNGSVIFETVRPGRVPGIDGALQAPHINMHIFSRGMLRHVSTRIYFAGDPANADDVILGLVPAARRDTLIVRPDPQQPGTRQIDFHMCGDGETVFFDA
jgi:protocatechuate 3,4-dioxygenase, alpha subunit